LCENNNICGVCAHCAKIKAGSHPDVLVYPKTQTFMVEDASNIYDKVQVKPMLANLKIFVINDLDLSTEQAQNKMLKIIEEPPKNVIFLMTACSEEKVLSTILSRVQKMRIQKFNKQTLKNMLTTENVENLDIALNFGDGYIGKTLDILNNNNFVDCYKNMVNLIKNMKKSEQIPFFSVFLNKDKVFFENALLILNDFFRDILILHYDKNNLIKHTNLIELYSQLVLEYSAIATNKILKKLNLYKRRLDRNVNLITLADNLLLDILEVKFLCK